MALQGVDFLKLTGTNPYVGGGTAVGAAPVQGPQKQQEGLIKPNYDACNCELRPEMADDKRAKFLDFDA